MPDANRACGMGLTGLLFAYLVAIAVLAIVMPSASFWIGLYVGLSFWVLFGTASGALVVGYIIGSAKENKLNSPGDALPPPSSTTAPPSPSGWCYVAYLCMGALLGGLLFPVVAPVMCALIAFAIFKSTKFSNRSRSLCVAFWLIVLVGGVTAACFFGIREIAARTCVVKLDNECVGMDQMKLPNSLHLELSSNWGDGQLVSDLPLSFFFFFIP